MYKGKLVKHSSSFSGNKKDNKILKVVQKILYDSGAFGNIPEYRAVDGIMGPLTRKAMAQYLSKGKLFGSFNSGTTKQPTNNNTKADLSNLSLEEYKELKRDEIRQKAARVNSQTITPDFPILAGGPQKGHDLDLYGKRKWSEDKVKTEFNYYISVAENYLRNNPNIEPLAKKRIQNTIKYYKKVVADPSYINKYGGGFGCIYTASGAYGDQFRYASNSDLANKILAGKDTGFQLVRDLGNPHQWKVGDIVQVGRSEKGNSPHHAEMVVSKSKLLGMPVLAQTNAEGYGPSDKENDVALHRYYERLESDKELGKPGGGQIIRFVGTKAQNKQWEQEYYAMKKRNGR